MNATVSDIRARLIQGREYLDDVSVEWLATASEYSVAAMPAISLTLANAIASLHESRLMPAAH